jgi:hypothetical protein
VRVSLLGRDTDRTVSTIDLSWPDLIRGLVPQQTQAPKRSLPAWSPTSFRDDRRLASHAETVSLGVLDLDDVTAAVVRATIDTIERASLQAYVHSTYSHDPASGKYRLRVIFPLSRPVLASEWPAWSTLWRRLWPDADGKAASDIARIYYAPFTRSLVGAIAIAFDGRPFPVDDLLAVPLPAIPAMQAEESVQRDTLLAIARRLKAHKNLAMVDMGHCLHSAMHGEPFAEVHNRDNTMWQMALMLADKLPTARPDAIAEHFALALTHMGPDCPTVEAFTDKIRRAQEQRATVVAAAAADALSLHQARIREALGDDRSHPYTDAELTRFRETEQCDANLFTHRWIIQHQHAYYVYRQGEYVGPYPESAAYNAITRDLSPSPCQLHTINGQGQVIRKPLATIVEEYGSVAVTSIASLCVQRTHYDSDNQRLIEVAGKMDLTLTPQYSAEVDRWLVLFAHEKYSLLCHWLSWVPYLDQPLPILFVVGPRGIGKTLLACGVGRIWRCAPIPMVHAMGDFNNRLIQSPFVFADEDVPRNRQGGKRMNEIRDFVQLRVHSLRRKFLPDTELHGCVRIMIAANDRSVIEFRDSLGYDDCAAIAERFLFIQGNPAAREYLLDTPHKHWIEEGVIARHVLHLAQHRMPAIGRFAVQDDANSVMQSLIIRSGLRSQLCRFAVEYLCEPRLADSTKRGFILIRDGQLLINVKAIHEHWQAYLGELPPRTADTNKALQTLCLPNAIVQGVDGSGNALHYRVIDTRNLIAWCTETEYCPAERVTNALQLSTDDRKAHTFLGTPSVVIGLADERAKRKAAK